MEKNWVKIYRSGNFYQAEIVKQMLLQHQIDAVLLNKKDTAYPILGKVEVYVHQEDFDHAIELLILNQIDHL